ncbi:hypothetical protein D9756_010536 [Leucocoprinus leucothites]|uniref:Uncharacterized protein n=1 Tax=Leucocoprinus leucothites TaxID=201217 RepID=A0A8H5CWB4_9AGAR|nr:hypothetical protein D9756_010536 [Leucoagaricus leucothites]
MSTPGLGGTCPITSNPDVSGIGVRTAIYAQTLLSFVPAIFSLLDREVVLTELKSLETQSMTLLIAAFAILISTIIQGSSPTIPLSNFHATIILGLSWMNNTNTFIYFLLWLFYEIDGFRHTKDGGDISKLRQIGGWIELLRHLARFEEREDLEGHPKATRRRLNIEQVIRTLAKRYGNHLTVLFFGSLHLSMMSAVGIWLWSRPEAFGGSGSCSLEAEIFVIGKGVRLGSQGLRVWSILMYSLLLIPIINLIPPILFFLSLHYLFHFWSPKYAKPDWSLLSPTIISLAILAIIDVILLVDIEVALKVNTDNSILEPGDSQWTYGQTLALLLLLLPFRDIVEVIRQQPSTSLGRDLFSRLDDGRGATQAALGALEKGADIRLTDSHGRTALILASEKGYLEIVNALVKRRPNFWAKDNSGGTALHAAAKYGYPEIIKILLSYESRNVGERDKEDRTPLDLAIENGNLKAAQALVERGDADPKLRGAPITELLQRYIDARPGNKSNWGVLRFATKEGHVEVVKALIKSRPCIKIEGEFGYELLCLAAKYHDEYLKHRILFDFLVEEYNQKQETSTALHMALLKGDLDIGKVLAKHPRFRPKIDAYDKHGNTPLDRTGQTALHLAAAYNNTSEIVRALLEVDKAGVIARVSDEDRQTALHRAAHNEHGARAVQLLLEHNAEPTTQNKLGETPLHRAASNDNGTESVRLLLEHGAQITAIDDDLSTALHHAAAHNRKAATTQILLRQSCAEINATDKHGRTPLHFAAANQYGAEIVLALLEQGAQIALKDEYGFTALDIAARDGHLDIVEILISSGAQIEENGPRNITAIHLAAGNGHLNIVRYLVEKAPKCINLKDKYGYTALDDAVKRDQQEVVKLLRSRGGRAGKELC